jgi:hypothetical protein
MQNMRETNETQRGGEGRMRGISSMTILLTCVGIGRAAGGADIQQADLLLGRHSAKRIPCEESMST